MGGQAGSCTIRKLRQVCSKIRVPLKLRVRDLLAAYPSEFPRCPVHRHICKCKSILCTEILVTTSPITAKMRRKIELPPFRVGIDPDSSRCKRSRTILPWVVCVHCHGGIRP